MFEHLWLGENKAYPGGVLNKLGKITVICGKNNSGKSTVLEAIANTKAVWFGKKITDDLVRQFIDETISQNWREQRPNEAYHLEAHIKAVFASREVWFNNELSVFSELYQQKPPQLRRLQLNTPQLPYQSLFPEKLYVGQITAKRKLETVANIQVQEVKFDATGILSHLNWLKNSSPGSDERGQYEVISEAFNNLSDGYVFSLTQEKNGNIFLLFSKDNKQWHNAIDCGLGLHELLIVLFFCHASKYNLLLIEEIENHLHPYMQKKLFRYLKSVQDKQFIISTHSSAFLDTSIADQIFYVVNDGRIGLKEVTNRAEVLKNLGYSISDNIVSDVIILVEGPTDVPVLEELLVKKGIIPAFDVKIWALGGDIMHHHDLEVFSQNYCVMALVDSDPKSSKSRNEFLKKCAALSIPAHRLKRYSIENYFPLSILKAVFPSQIQDGTLLDNSKKLRDQIGIDVKKNNRKIAMAMSLEDISGTDLDAFLSQISQACHKTRTPSPA